MIVVILQPDFRKLGRIKCQARGEAGAFATEHVEGIKGPGIAGDIFSAEPGDPARLEPPKELRIKAPVLQSFRRQKGRGAGSSLEAAVEPFALPGDKWESGVGAGRFPFPVKVQAVNLGAFGCTAIVWSQGRGGAAENRLVVGYIDRARQPRHEKKISRAAQTAIQRRPAMEAVGPEAVLVAEVDGGFSLAV